MATDTGTDDVSKRPARIQALVDESDSAKELDENAAESVHEGFVSVYGEVEFNEAYVLRVTNHFYAGPRDNEGGYVAMLVRQLCHEFDYAPGPVIEWFGLDPWTEQEFEPFPVMDYSIRQLPSSYSQEERAYWQDVYEWHLPECVRWAIEQLVEERNEDPDVHHEFTTFDITRVYYCYVTEVGVSLRAESADPRDVMRAERNETEELASTNEFVSYQLTGDLIWYVDKLDFDRWTDHYYLPSPLSIGAEISRRAVELYTDEPASDDGWVVTVSKLPDGYNDADLKWRGLD